MKLYSENKDYKLYEGNMLDMLEVIEPNSIDSIVCDPPYELNFMNKGWDNSGIAFNKDTWGKCLQVLKPGGYLLAFGGSRTYHRIACAIEDAGFEIRDTIMWLYGSGFPKSMNIGLAIDKKNGVESKIIETKTVKKLPTTGIINYEKEGWRKGGYDIEYQKKKATNKWNGWGTCLKPSFEPIIVARKPLEGSCIENIIKYGVGGINIDECRVGTKHFEIKTGEYDEFNNIAFGHIKRTPKEYDGRFPANTILTYDNNDFEEVCSNFPKTNSGKQKLNSEVHRKGISEDGSSFNSKTCGFDVNKGTGLCSYGDSGSASRYFYCAKASKKDRDEGLDGFEESRVNDGRKSLIDNAFQRGETPRKNIHPTVKPTNLMQYLVRLVTPNKGTVLDPFNGSGSTGKAVMYENREKNKNYKYIGIELTEEYLPIAKCRIEYVCNLPELKLKEMQLSLFDEEE